MKNKIYACLILFSLISCLKNEVNEVSQIKEFEEPLNLEFNDFEMISKYNTNEVEKLHIDLSNFLTLDTSKESDEFDDVPNEAIIQLRQLFDPTENKTGYTLKLVENSSNIETLSSECPANTKTLCNNENVLLFVKSIYTGAHDIDLFYSKDDCITLTWTRKDC